MRNSDYCSMFGEHKGNPCYCGWSSAKDRSDFIIEYIYYTEWYTRETGKNGTSTLMEFLDWLLSVSQQSKDTHIPMEKMEKKGNELDFTVALK